MKRLSLVLMLLLVTGCERGGDSMPPAELQALVDSMLPGLERLSGLERRGELDMALQSPEAVRAYVETQLADELPPELLEGMQASYVRLGLVPDSLDLRALLLDLYTEQIVGYYDPASRRLFVVEGVDGEALRPVLAHELVHALQDQHANLDSLIARERGNDRQSAAQAAIEGHATLVMFAFLAEEASGRELDPVDLPDPTAQLAPALAQQNEQFPVFRNAPPIIRETLLFPYVAGAGFVHALWRARAPQRPAPLGAELPQSTEQILHVGDRFLTARDEPTEIVFRDRSSTADSASAPAGSTRYENTLGELETRIWLRTHLGESAADVAAGWDGDRIRLQKDEAGRDVLVWWSVWDDAAAADRFENAARRAAQRSSPVSHVERTELDGLPAVGVVLGEAGVVVAGVMSGSGVTVEGAR